MKQKIIITTALLLSATTPTVAATGIATFYSHGCMADGSGYGSHGSMFCARNSRIKLGTKWLVSCNGRSKIISCRDHGPLSMRHFDLSTSAFCFFSHDKPSIGVLHISYKEVKIARYKRRRP